MFRILAPIQLYRKCFICFLPDLLGSKTIVNHRVFCRTQSTKIPPTCFGNIAVKHKKILFSDNETFTMLGLRVSCCINVCNAYHCGLQILSQNILRVTSSITSQLLHFFFIFTHDGIQITQSKFVFALQFVNFAVQVVSETSQFRHARKFWMLKDII